ncbi:MAG: hypothetical protein Q4C54_07310 [Clostridia bacterium]|nr:hypothetical protein [Clostridia bacterium]
MLFFALTRGVYFTYTIIAAWLVCAACAQVTVCIGYEKRDYLRGMVWAIVLACLSMLLRVQVILPLLCFCGLAGAAQLLFAPGETKEDKAKAIRRIVAMGCAAAVCVGALYASDALNKRRPEFREYVAINDARTEVNDYHADVTALTEEQLDILGWTREEANMLDRFCTLDYRFTPEKLQQAVRFARENEPIHFHFKVILGVRSMLQDLPGDPVFPVLLAMLALTLVMVLRRTGWKTRLMLLSVPLFSLLQLLYLYVAQRYPTRALVLAVYPAFVVTAVLFILRLKPRNNTAAKRITGIVACAGALMLCCCSAAGFKTPVISLTDDFTPGQRQMACDEYARSHPDLFFFTDITLDDSLYQDTASPRVQNLAQLIGWQTVNPDYYAQLAQYGINREDTDMTVFLRDDVRLIAGRGRVYRALVAAIEKLADGPVEIIIEDTVDELPVIRFVVTE